jgi:boron transporter
VNTVLCDGLIPLTPATVKGVEELVAQFDEGIGGEGGKRSGGYLAIVIALCYWFTVSKLEKFGNTSYSRSWFRKAISDYAYPVSPLTSQ